LEPSLGQAAGGHGLMRDRGDLWEAGGQIFRYADLVALAKS
jgi:hypothetical protein